MGKKKVIGIISVVISVIAVVGIVIVYNLFYSMSRLPEGELISESISFDGKYTVRTYLCNGGATVDYAVRGELVTTDKKTKNIYWAYKTSNGEISWEDNDTVIVNGKKIKLPDGKYDWRNK